MAASKVEPRIELNTAIFMEEIQKYDCLYNKFSLDYKEKFKRLNCWDKIGEKFNLLAAEAKKKYKNIRTAYGRYLKKRKSVPFGSGRDAVPIPLQFANLKWLSPYISHRLSVSNFNTERRDGGASEEKLELDLQYIADHDNSENDVDCFDGTRRNDEPSCRSTTPLKLEKTYLRPKRELLLNQRNWSLVMG